MIRHVHVSPATRDALRTLAGRAIERIFVTGEVRVVRRLRDDARRLEVSSPDGRRYSGVLVVHGNEVTTGAVVPSEVPSADLVGEEAQLAAEPSATPGANVEENELNRFARQLIELSQQRVEPACSATSRVAEPDVATASALELSEVAE